MSPQTYLPLQREDFSSKISLIHLVSLQMSVDSMTTQLPFSVDETRKQLLLAAPKSHRRRRRRNKGMNCQPSYCETDVEAEVATLLPELDDIFTLEEEQGMT